MFAALLAVILNTKLKRRRRNKDRGEDESESNSSTQEDHIYQQPLLSDIFLPGGDIELGKVHANQEMIEREVQGYPGQIREVKPFSDLHTFYDLAHQVSVKFQ